MKTMKSSIKNINQRLHDIQKIQEKVFNHSKEMNLNGHKQMQENK